MSRIPQSFIQDLIARTDIVELIQTRIHLKKAGNNYQACCPFHDEKTPSFSVSPSKQFYYCFGCSAHGNALNFLMQYDRMEFVDGVEFLAQQLGVEVPRESTQNPQAPSKDYQALYQLLGKVRDFYILQLKNTPKAIDYLKSRHLTGKVAKTFQIGYAPEGWDNLITHLGESDTLVQNLLETGMLVNKDYSKPYDRFRHRIMFPIRDVKGQIVGFGGRALGQANPKYLNSPETEIYHKSQELYGLYEVRQHNKDPANIIVVEGYLDVIMLHQHGIYQAVATLGTAVNRLHIQKLLRYTNELIFCFDGDHAGRGAAWKALTISLPLLRDGIHLRFLFLPEGDDPDSLVQKIGAEAFNQQLKQAKSIEKVFFEHLDQEINHEDFSEKAEFAKTAKQYLEQMPEGIYKDLMLEQLANHLDLNKTQLHVQPMPSPASLPLKTPVTQKKPKQALSATELAIALLLQCPKIAQNLGSLALLEQPRNPSISLLDALLTLFKKYPDLHTGNLLANWPDDTQREWIAELASREFPLDEEALCIELTGAIKQVINQQRQSLCTDLIQKSKRTALSPEEKQQLQALLMDKSE